MNKYKQHVLPIVLILCGILDQTTDVLPTLLTQMNAPAYFGTIFKLVVIVLGGIKLYLSKPTIK